MRRLGLEREIVDRTVYDHAIKRFREARIALPAFAELAEPTRRSGPALSFDGYAGVRRELAGLVNGNAAPAAGVAGRLEGSV